VETQTRNDERYVRSITKGKKPTYLNISIPTKIAELMDLRYRNFVKLYLNDNNSRLIIEKMIL
jgi:hypothetical protein